ncbi:MAG: DUF4397 domain-containing protein [FCB group bacterium]|jgi:hypothetical protein
MFLIKATKIFKIFILFILTIFIFSCAKESPDLLNPPPQFKTVKCRFINLAGDRNDRVCVLDRTVKSGTVKFAATSDSFMPPADSSIISVQLNGVQEFSNLVRTRFLRDTYFTLVGLPSVPGRPVQKYLDTVYVLSTIAGLGANTNFANITIFNAYPDTTRFYSVNLGCPNGFALGSGLTYRVMTAPQQVQAGYVAVSLSLSQNNKISIIGLYNLNLKATGQYVLIIYQKQDGSEGVLLLDEFDDKTDALLPADIVPDRTSDVRTINFSRIPVTIKRIPNDTVAVNVRPNFISDYKLVGACKSSSLDSMAVFAGNSLMAFAPTSLEVLNKFTVLVFDSANSNANNAVVAPPVHLTEPSGGRSIVRVVHGAYNLPFLIVSIGARVDSADTNTHYSSGSMIAKDIPYGQISGYQLVTPGTLPVTLFSSSPTQPTQLLYNSIVTLEPDKYYLLVVTNNHSNGDSLGITLIEDNQISSNISFESQGGFTQVVDLIPDVVSINLNMPPVLYNAKLYYTGSLASVLPLGDNTINIAGKPTYINANNYSRNLIIAAGTNQNPDIITLQYPPFDVSTSNFKRRYINACKDIGSISVRVVGVNCDTCFEAQYILYGSTSGIYEVSLDRKNAFVFVNDATNQVLLSINDIYLPQGKNFSIIFGGSTANGYTAVIQQEF